MLRNRAILLTATLAVAHLCQPAVASIIAIDPRATYLTTKYDPFALNAAAVDLSALGLEAGDLISLQRLGDFNYFPLGLGPEGTSLAAVFSSTSTLLAADQSHRVVGAIDAGSNYATGPTLFHHLATDIAEDFFVPGGLASVVVEIPVGAAFLFFTVNDSYFGDNSDPDRDFAVSITAVNPSPSEDLRVDSAPAPSSFLVFAIGGAFALAFRCLRGRRIAA